MALETISGHNGQTGKLGIGQDSTPTATQCGSLKNSNSRLAGPLLGEGSIK